MPLYIEPVTPEKDPAQDLARMVVQTQYTDLPANAIERAKQALLDTLGIMIGGSTATSGPVIADYFKRWSGSGEGRVLFHGYRAPAPLAAFANGVFGRALDLGDVSVEGGHVSEFVVPALLSGVDVTERKISGKDFLTAYNVAAEWGVRHHSAMRLHVHNVDGVPGEAGWTMTTPALAKLFGLSLEETLNAVGISFTCHGLPEQEKYYEGRESVRISHGSFTSTSMMAVDMARMGITGPNGIYKTKSGFCRFVVWDDIKPELLTEGLGTRWLWTEDLTVKPYPSCKYTHATISAVSKLCKAHHIDWREIADIHILVNPSALVCCWPSRWKPESKGDAMFSIPYTAATMAMTGDVWLDSFEEGPRTDPEKLELMQKIHVDVNPDPNCPNFDSYPVTITMKDGNKYTLADDKIPGDLSNPFTWEQLEDKFWKCVPYCAVKLPEENLRKVVELCKNLEQVEDMRQLTDLLVP